MILILIPSLFAADQTKGKSDSDCWTFVSMPDFLNVDTKKGICFVSSLTQIGFSQCGHRQFERICFVSSLTQWHVCVWISPLCPISHLWNTLLRKTLNPSDRTQVPSFFTIQSSISLSLSCSSPEHKVTIVLTRSSKSLTCWNIFEMYVFFFSLQNVVQTKHTSGNIK